MATPRRRVGCEAKVPGRGGCAPNGVAFGPAAGAGAGAPNAKVKGRGDGGFCII